MVEEDWGAGDGEGGIVVVFAVAVAAALIESVVTAFKLLRSS